MPTDAQVSAPSVFIATPCYGGMVTEAYLLSTIANIAALSEADTPSMIRTLAGRSRISAARNTLVALFLQTDCSHLAFVDADMAFPADALQRLLAHDRDIVAAACPKKKYPVEWCFAPLSDTADDSGLIEVKYVGTGFVLIRRSVFELIAAADAVPLYKDREVKAQARAFFMETIQSDVLVGEDCSFCLLWRALGGRVWVDPELRLGHVGSTVYRG